MSTPHAYRARLASVAALVGAPACGGSGGGGGTVRTDFTPLRGDWNGDGIDTVGLYDPASGTFFLKNTNSGGGADLTFDFTPGP